MALRLGGRDRSRHLVRVARRALEATAPRRPRREAASRPCCPESLTSTGHGRALRHRRRRRCSSSSCGRGSPACRAPSATSCRPSSTSSSGSASCSRACSSATCFRPFNPWRAIGRAGGVGRQPAARRAARGRPSVPGEARLLAGGRRALRLRLAGAARVDGHLAPHHRRRDARVLERDLSRHGHLRGRAVGARGEAFSVYFGLFARMSLVERRGRELVLRPPLTGLASLKPEWNLVAVLSVMIGTVTFDGLQETAFWSRVGPRIADGMRALGAGPSLGDELAGGIGMLACVARDRGLLPARDRRSSDRGRRVFRAGARRLVRPLARTDRVRVRRARTTSRSCSSRDRRSASARLRSARAWLGHLRHGGLAIDYGLIGATVTWYVQVAVVVAGHCAGLALAHDRALDALRGATTRPALAILDARGHDRVHEPRALAPLAGERMIPAAHSGTGARPSRWPARW